MHVSPIKKDLISAIGVLLGINKSKLAIIQTRLVLAQMNYHSPFGSPSQHNYSRPPLPRNYSEIFDPAEYECKSDLDLESYARNLSNYLNKLLTETPFPAFLFEKLEKRYNGIISILKKRSAAKGVSTTAKEAEERLRRLNAELDAHSSTQPVEPDDVEDHRPTKKRKFEFNEEVKRELQRERQRKALSQTAKPTEEEEEED